MLDEYDIFSCWFVEKIVVMFEKTKINEKEAGVGPSKKGSSAIVINKF